MENAVAINTITVAFFESLIYNERVGKTRKRKMWIYNERG
jgi:hypothetical protein